MLKIRRFLNFCERCDPGYKKILVVRTRFMSKRKRESIPIEHLMGKTRTKVTIFQNLDMHPLINHEYKIYIYIVIYIYIYKREDDLLVKIVRCDIWKRAEGKMHWRFNVI